MLEFGRGQDESGDKAQPIRHRGCSRRRWLRILGLFADDGFVLRQQAGGQHRVFGECDGEVHSRRSFRQNSSCMRFVQTG